VQLILLILILVAGMTASVLLRKLTPAGATCGGLLGLLLFLGAGWTGVLLMAVFFILGTAATAWKRSTKVALGIAEENKGRRHAGQVLANGGMGAACGLVAWLWPQYAHGAQLMAAAAFSSAAADTLSSELGSIYGKNFYHILTFKKDRRGLDGVISLEGLLLGLCGSCIIALVYSTGFDRWREIAWILIAGTLGNLADSVAGAAWERRGFIGNDTVNFLNTAFASAVALLCFSVSG